MPTEAPAKSGGGSSRMTDVIKNIEAMCTGQVSYLEGYELDDDFLDLSDEVWILPSELLTN